IIIYKYRGTTVLAVTKESVKTFTYESLNNVVRLINGVSALLLTILPGNSSILEGIHGWELRPTFRGPRLPRWMENGVSSFNQFIHEFSIDSNASSSLECSLKEEDCDENICPKSPLLQSPRASRASSFTMQRSHWVHLLGYIFSWFFFPVKFMVGIPLYLYGSSRSTGASSTSGSLQPSNIQATKRLRSLRDHFVQRATDRRRGVVEDLHLAIEIIIEAVFEFVRKAAHCLLSPIVTFTKVVKWFFSHMSGCEDVRADGSGVSIPVDTLSENDPTPKERQTSFYHSLNIDARTCQDVITELGYPYEALRVVTRDGYILLLERIPRRDARKVVYLQHGVFDSSMGWVSNGVVGSPAFAAYDQGYDVFLGNFRGLVSREHIDSNISSTQYWQYSINEHGTEDIPAMTAKIHEIKVSELKTSQAGLEEQCDSDQPYELCAISHSLGGAAILMYAITQRIWEKPHRLSRLILLSPAGFHHDSNPVFTVMEYLFLVLSPLLMPFVPAFYIPTRFFRMLVNKLARDFHNLPAVGGLVQTLISYGVGGDSSNWIGALGLPHYNMNDMPAVSFRVALHMAQIKHGRKFIMFDYGSAAANMEVYGASQPLDLGEFYLLIDIPVDLVAGQKDKVIRPSMVRKHYELMTHAGVEVSYNEFEYAHLDFTFSHREELLAYVMSRLTLVGHSTKQPTGQKSLRHRRNEGQSGSH
uniref:Partial AB-hydrolase lipase domain-containing protein n=3 Tax=Nicotiana TaxID=4085 RepID=A0A1S4CTU4_TOBAC